MINRFILLILSMLVAVPSGAADIVVNPDQSTPIVLSSENPNRIICNDGDINDLAVPKDLPIDPKAKFNNLFVTYQKLQRPDGTLEMISAEHTLHVVCDSEVYTLQVTPKRGKGVQIRLGNPLADKMRENMKIRREKSEEEIISQLIKAAYHNDLPPNYTVVEKNQLIDAQLNSVDVQLIREVSLNGIGLTLKEYIVSGAPGDLVPHRMFIEKGIRFSTRLRGISVKPEQLPESGRARLFVLEDKI